MSSEHFYQQFLRLTVVKTPVQTPLNSPKSAPTQPTNKPTLLNGAVQTHLNGCLHPNVYSPQVFRAPPIESLMRKYQRHQTALVQKQEDAAQSLAPPYREPEPTPEELRYTYPADLEAKAQSAYPLTANSQLRQLFYLHQVEHWPFPIIAQKLQLDPQQAEKIYHHEINQLAQTS